MSRRCGPSAAKASFGVRHDHVKILCARSGCRSIVVRPAAEPRNKHYVICIGLVDCESSRMKHNSSNQSVDESTAKVTGLRVIPLSAGAYSIHMVGISATIRRQVLPSHHRIPLSDDVSHADSGRNFSVRLKVVSMIQTVQTDSPVDLGIESLHSILVSIGATPLALYRDTLGTFGGFPFPQIRGGI